MAKGKKTGGRNFTVGHPPMGGRPALSPEIIEARKLNRNEVELILSKIAQFSHGQLLDYLDQTLNKHSGNVLEVLICRVLDRGIKKGDINAVNFLLDRLIGKIPPTLDVSEQGFVIRVLDYVKAKEIP